MTESMKQFTLVGELSPVDTERPSEQDADTIRQRLEVVARKEDGISEATVTVSETSIVVQFTLNAESWKLAAEEGERVLSGVLDQAGFDSLSLGPRAGRRTADRQIEKTGTRLVLAS